MVVLVGPCMFAAPLVVLLVPVAIVLWPVALAGLGVSWLVLWPAAWVAARLDNAWLPERHRTLGRWFGVVLKPWNYFDEPKGTRD